MNLCIYLQLKYVQSYKLVEQTKKAAIVQMDEPILLYQVALNPLKTGSLTSGNAKSVHVDTI